MLRLLGVILACVSLLAAEKGKMPAGSKVFIESTDGFDIYMTKALEKKHVPVTVVSGNDQADFILSVTGSSEERTTLSDKIHHSLNGGSEHKSTIEDAAMKVINRSTGAIVMVEEIQKANAFHGKQSAAEALAKKLNEVIVK